MILLEAIFRGLGNGYKYNRLSWKSKSTLSKHALEIRSLANEIANDK